MCEEGLLASWALMHLIREDVIGRRTCAGECCAWTRRIPRSSTFMWGECHEGAGHEGLARRWT